MFYLLNSQKDSSQNSNTEVTNGQQHQISYFSSGGTFFAHEQLQRLPEEIIDECKEEDDVDIGNYQSNSANENRTDLDP